MGLIEALSGVTDLGFEVRPGCRACLTSLHAVPQLCGGTPVRLTATTIPALLQWVWLPGLQDRVDALANDTVDFVLSGFGATTAREVSPALGR